MPESSSIYNFPLVSDKNHRTRTSAGANRFLDDGRKGQELRLAPLRSRLGHSLIRNPRRYRRTSDKLKNHSAQDGKTNQPERCHWPFAFRFLLSAVCLTQEFAFRLSSLLLYTRPLFLSTKGLALFEVVTPCYRAGEGFTEEQTPQS